MTLRQCAAALLLSMAAATAAWADERPPRYDTNALCVRLSTTADGLSPELLSQCLIDQGEAYDALRRIWTSTPEYIQEDCTIRARSDGDGDYIILQNCIRAQNAQTAPDTMRGR